MQKFIGTWRNRTTDELIEISGVYPGDSYLLKYDFSNGDYKKEEEFVINIGIPTGVNEIEVFDTRYSNKFGHQQFTVFLDCLTVDKQVFVRVK
jgi:hypothetical protein